VTDRTIAIPRLMHVGGDCLAEFAPLLRDYAFNLTRVCVASGGGPSVAFADRVGAGLQEDGVEIVRTRQLEGRLAQAAELAGQVIEHEMSLLVAVGGGRVIDTVKLAAARTGIDFVSVPTAIAHDGISSPVASLTGKDGIRQSHAAAMPAGIIVDIEVIASAPARTLRAGVGDLVSNLTANLDWQLADRRGHDRYDAFSAMIAESAARPALDLPDLSSRESHDVLAKGLLLSGLAMAAAGTSRPCSGAEHLVSHSLDALLGPRAAFHGEQVALGALISAAAHQSPVLPTLQELFARLELPTTPSELGISEEEMAAAIARAPGTRPDRYTVLSEVALDPSAVVELTGRAFAGVPS
jgi:glycerol-1-phosphate dehydrogenase [NAD(P)+]